MEETKYIIRDWSSAIDLRNTLHPTWRISVDVYRNCETQEINGYSIEVYDKSHSECNCNLVYKIDVDVTIDGHYSFSTEEAIEFLNIIGFNCEFDKSAYVIPEKAKELLAHFYALGYQTIVRIVRPWCKILMSLDPEDDIARRLFYTDIVKYYKEFQFPKGVICPEVLEYRDFLFLPPNTPYPINQLIGD